MQGSYATTAAAGVIRDWQQGAAITGVHSLYCSTHLTAQGVEHNGTQLARLLHGCLEIVQGAPVVLDWSPCQIKPE